VVIAIAIVGTLVGALQAASLFILSDLRDRIMRLENAQMTNPPTWKVERVTA
jgi:hypothetical protein